MRLSEKGTIHLNEWTVHKLPMNAFVFKPEDFTDCVVLTIEEAKVIKHLLDIAYCTYILDEKQLEVDKKFNERIEQAEKKQ